MSAPTIALYLGESYATLGVFDSKENQILEKSVFLPQVSFKNLITQTKQLLIENEFLTDSTVENNCTKFYIVTKYLNRLKNFKLGGSVAQIVEEGYENAYCASNSNNLSLAASSLIISINPNNLNADFLNQEISRLRKINPDLSKIVVQLSESRFKSEQLQWVHDFLSEQQFKIFTCTQPENLSESRKELLNAGTEGTKEELISDIKEIFNEHAEIYIWCDDQFKNDFQNHELFNSSNSFLAHLAKNENYDLSCYLDHESFRIIPTFNIETWQSPWGKIATPSHQITELTPHPYSEVQLNSLSILTFSEQIMQHEPGPASAGRGIKPLVIDLFYKELSKNSLTQKIFPLISTESLKNKIENIFSILEKGQSENSFTSDINELKNLILENIKNEIKLLSANQKVKINGPLGSLIQKNYKEFNWSKEIFFQAKRQGI